MEALQKLVYYLVNFLNKIGVNSIFELIAFIGCIYFLVKRFILRKAPVPSSAFKTVPHELLKKCVEILQRKEKKSYAPYKVPEEILEGLKKELNDEVNLKRLLCDICAHLGLSLIHI